MKILLTGGTGFLGRALLRHWMAVEEPPQVTVLSRDPSGFLGRHPGFAALPWLQFHEGDILDPASFPAGATFTHLLHAAADSTAGPQLTPFQRYAQIVDGTRHLLDYAVHCGVPRFLFTSSGGVYGVQPPGMPSMPEDYHGMPDPLDAHNAYGVAKRCAEHLCALYAQQHGLQTIVARCFAFVGRDLPVDAHFAVGNFIGDALMRSHVTVKGDGSPLRTYMDQRDLAHWLDVLLKEGRAGEAYNVGSDEVISIAELAHLVRNLLAPGKTIRITGDDTGGLRNRYVPSIAKASVELGLRLRYTLPEAVIEAASHLGGPP